MKEPIAHPDFPIEESNTLEFWKEKGIREKYIHKNDNSDKKFRFLDGPITANNPMGVHHAHGRTIKDFYQRYYNMRGYKQRFQNGFDCQGLWVEVEEEKDLGFNSKADIEQYGIGAFCSSCSARVDKFSKVQMEQSKRLGMFMDWEHSYYTMSERNNLHIWHFLKKVDEKGWLYKGVDAMPWCTRCGTAISQHELSDGGYKDVTHESIYLRFKLQDEAKELLQEKFNLEDKSVSFLVWTTTPWTLLANTAIAVSPKVMYSIVKSGDEYLIFASARLEKVEGDKQVVKELSGKELLELLQDITPLYYHPFKHLPRSQKQSAKRIIAWDEVADNEGTGIVHIAPSAGKEDFELGKKLGLGFDAPSIDEFGIYTEGFGEYTGMDVFDVKEKVFASLKKDGLFYTTEEILHSYPHCWRCKHELVFRTTEEWFISVDEIRPLMKEAAKTVNWMPAHAGKRMQDWLDNMGPWPISRKRYWGLALPFYENEDKTKYYVVESKEELKRLALEPEKVDSLKELHRPWIDEIKLDGSKIVIDGEKQEGVWTRVTDVGDCWLDAGIVPFSTVDYLTNKDYWKEWYPFDFITEYVAQVKLWFYATLFMSVALQGKAPWKNVLATGFLVDEDGKHMHKSAGNAIAFDEAASKAGADAIRWLYLREKSANYYGTGNLRFGYNILNDVRRRFLVILWNSYRFIVQNALMDNWDYSMLDKEYKSDNVLDKWIVSRIESVMKVANERLPKYDSPLVAENIENFVVKDFSQWYIRRSRDRVGPSVTGQDKESFYQTSFYVLDKLIRLLAPFVPFISEQMYQNIRTPNHPESVHLTDWPNLNEQLIDSKLEEQMTLARSVVEKVHSRRKELGIKVRQPLAQATIYSTTTPEISDEIIQVLLDEINVKKIEFVKKDVEEMIAQLDTKLTPELEQEGLIRELIRQIQTVRRDAGYKINQEIKLSLILDNELNFVKDFEDELKRKVVASEISYSQLKEEPDAKKQANLNGHNIEIAVKAL